MSKKECYYEILGISKNATENEIKLAYKKLVIINHPDKITNSADKEIITKKFHKIQKAYEVLKDPNKRRNYDLYGENFESTSGGSNNFNWSNMNDFEWSSYSSGNNNNNMNEEFFQDIFGEFFSKSDNKNNAKNKENEKTIRGEDLTYNLSLKLEDIYSGYKKIIKIRKKIKCENCNNQGVSEKDNINCKKCNGKGTVNFRQFIFNFSQKCDYCFGKGKICITCSGEGRFEKLIDYEIIVPKGVLHDQELKFKQEGNSGVRGGFNGDFIIKINIEKHSIFKIKGNDLYLDLPIDLFDAILKKEIDVPLINGNIIKIKAPDNIQNGQNYKILGKGIPYFNKNNSFGDLYLIFNIILPKVELAEYENWIELQKLYINKSNNKNIFTKIKNYIKNII